MQIYGYNYPVYAGPVYAGGYSAPVYYGGGGGGYDSYMGSYGQGDYQAVFAQQCQQMQAAWQQRQQQMQMQGQQRQDSQQFHGRIAKSMEACDSLELREIGKGLNREEFIAISAEQNQLARALAKYSADGVLTSEERADLASRRNQLQQKLKAFRDGDFHPTLQSNDPVSQRDAALAGKLYDMVHTGKMSPEAAKNLRVQMSLAAQQDGVDEANQGPGQDTLGQALERREELEFLLDMEG
ncbi:hypothetical protein JST97_35405 [bacterium]|nr:hypothetical protein [bacterium]